MGDARNEKVLVALEVGARPLMATSRSVEAVDIMARRRCPLVSNTDFSDESITPGKINIFTKSVFRYTIGMVSGFVTWVVSGSDHRPTTHLSGAYDTGPFVP